MERRTTKVGITGKYGTRYGQKLRKQVKAMEILQRTTYTCPFCGKTGIQRKAAGVWHCSACRRNIAGGAWEYSTIAAQTAKTTINRLKKVTGEVKKAKDEEMEVEDEDEVKKDEEEGEKKERPPKKKKVGNNEKKGAEKKKK